MSHPRVSMEATEQTLTPYSTNSATSALPTLNRNLSATFADILDFVILPYVFVTSSKCSISTTNEEDLRPAVVIVYGESSKWLMPTVGGRIRWPAVQQWISDCSDQHQCARSEPWEVPQGFRLIDVDDRRVVSKFPSASRLGRDIKFVALSYVWGTGSASKDDALLGSNSEELAAPSGLGKIRVPKAVEDAMTVCRQLNQRFLWVDRFCIRQDDHGPDKQAQIIAMGDIFSSAEFTIIHASGTSMHDPIAGVSTPREVIQLKVKACGLDFVLSPPKFMVALQASKWIERGWTYQEAVLSRRKLFFTPFELWFECDNENAPYQREDQYPQFSFGQKKELYRITDHSVGTTTFHHFVRHVEFYTPRSLTYQSDNLAAFMGILTTLYNGGPILHGLAEADFDQALLWHCKAKHLSPADAIRFPSWSWASVNEAVSAPTIKDGLGFRAALVQWSYKDQNGELKIVQSKDDVRLGDKRDLTAGAYLLFAWWKGCIEPEVPADVKQLPTIERADADSTLRRPAI
ncbi:hypothetical protein MKX07_003584 [Trichoderma sp. CBMAI-0711]|nr:hypothetical protein MKX07_003584 [Trichoderma sp. CBMAI-0711]